MTGPPPLPPRASSFNPVSSSSKASNSSAQDGTRRSSDLLTAEDALRPSGATLGSSHPYGSSLGKWSGNDPRSSSMQSLRPTDSNHDGKRVLLVVYIHGFLGDETSFQSFPAHVHNLLTTILVESHVVHTKVYPRYKSRKNISFARDEFSDWLSPHESPHTDVVLVGHSLGGILAAEVTLLKSRDPQGSDLHQHKILGLITFDTPFLGMHPSVVKTGIASLFRTSVDKSDTPLNPPSSTNSMDISSDQNSSHPMDPPPYDPNYNPAFLNDIVRPQRSKLESAWYFWNKHCGELTKATRSYVTSHFEFGGCLADYPGLKRRYKAIRAHEDVDELSKPRDNNGKLLRRIRFVNYYSASTGRIKERREKSPARNDDLSNLPPESIEALSVSPSHSASSISLRSSMEEHANGHVFKEDTPQASGTDIGLSAADDMEKLEVTAVPDVTTAPGSVVEDAAEYEDLPPVPPVPAPPERFDASLYKDKDTLKVAQKEHARRLKAYERAQKDRESTIKDREKLTLKREKKAARELLQAQKKAAQQQKIEESQTIKQNTTLNPEVYGSQLQRDHEMMSTAPDQKKQKDRIFCALPAKDPSTGLRDPAWIRVYMQGVDEVTAHTSMFFLSDTYAKVVGDTATRIKEWLEEDATKDALLAELDAQCS